MQGVTILKNESNNHRLIQIDLDELNGNEDALEDILDIITVEMRKDEESVAWNDVKKQMQS